MYTIYIKQSSIQILSPSDEGQNEIKSEAETLHFDGNKVSCLNEIISWTRKMLQSEVSEHLHIISSHPKQVLKSLKDSLKYIKAAGGLVKNEKKQYLFIFRHGVWDLPKGKLEEEEEIETCAQREVEEECGVEVTSVKKEIPSTYHIYEQKGDLIIKRTYWFLMKGHPDSKLIPQTDEGIEEVRWFSQAEFSLIRANTFPSVLEVMKSIPE